MEAFRIDPPDLSTYPKKWQESKYVCDCGMGLVIHFEELSTADESQPFTHQCGRGHVIFVPGRLMAVWEVRNGNRFFIPQQS